MTHRPIWTICTCDAASCAERKSRWDQLTFTLNDDLTAETSVETVQTSIKSAHLYLSQTFGANAASKALAIWLELSAAQLRDEWKDEGRDEWKDEE